METLAYIQLAVAYEQSPDVPLAAPIQNFLHRLETYKLARRGCVRLLSIGISLSIPMLVEEAIAVQRGDSGTTVNCVQQRLSNLGYFNGPFTGFYGSLTEGAVIQFQRDYRLSVDGIAGSATLSKLGCSGQPTAGNYCENGKLARGSSGSAVSALQQDLKTAGFYDGRITGYFGEVTEGAVIAFQRYYGLVEDGVVGTATLNAIRAHKGEGSQPSSNATQPSRGKLSRGATGQAVTDLQLSLRSLGFYSSPITGNFDSSTEDAVIRFQKRYGLQPDGIVGSKTRATLEGVASGQYSENPDALASQ